MKALEELTIYWKINYTCNYKCPYCDTWGGLNVKENLSKTVFPDQWEKYWKKFYDNYGFFYLYITGGEPFLYPNFIKLVNEISKLYSVSIKTNLFFEPKDIFDNFNSDRVNIEPYFHPLFTDINLFIEKNNILIKKGFVEKTFYVAYEKQKEQFQYYKDRFKKQDIICELVPMGEFKKRINPVKYKNTKNENDKIFAYIEPDGGIFNYDKSNAGNIMNKDIDINTDILEVNKYRIIRNDVEKKYIEKKEITPEFTWFFWHICNYRCSYCFYNDEWENLDKYFENITIEKIIKTWDKIYYKYGSSDIGLAGAEPTIYPGFLKLLKILTKHHKVNFNTNMSWGLEKIEEFISELNPENIIVTCSFHPEFAKIEDFIKKACLLKESGFFSDQEVVCVGWPPILKDIAEYKKEFSKRDINFRIQPFNGEYKGKKYPNSYSKREREFIYSLTEDQIAQNRLFVSYQIGAKNPKGKLCRAGQVRAEIGGNGVVYRCSQCKEKPLGKFLDGEFKLLEEPLPCKSDYCPCDFRYLVEYENAGL